jgi:hypothetical protein
VARIAGGSHGGEKHRERMSPEKLGPGRFVAREGAADAGAKKKKHWSRGPIPCTREEAASEGDGLSSAGPLTGEATGAQGLNQLRKAGITRLDFLCAVGPAALVTTPVPQGFAPPWRSLAAPAV